ncbi:MAG: DUF4112 domain-containing protein [Moorea sp. SIO2B7]|nr:DUF4112 domain-containing protein [Moorena sp. SIO2B7]
MNNNKSKINSRETTLNRLRSLSHLLDNAIPIPGTSYRIGIDPLLGLFPAAGDYLSAAFSAYIVIQAAQIGASKATLSRMTLNIILDTLVGTIPMLGDLFDFSWKANTKNMALLESHANSPDKTKKADGWFLGLLLIVLTLVVVVTTAVSVMILGFLLKIITSL